MNKQNGYINMDLSGLFVFALIGVVAVLFGVPAFIYWLFQHVEIVIK